MGESGFLIAQFANDADATTTIETSTLGKEHAEGELALKVVETRLSVYINWTFHLDYRAFE